MTSASLRDRYRASIVEIDDGNGPVPAHASALLDQGPVHVITAWNPGSVTHDRTANDEANARLFTELRRRGLDPVPACGSDPRSTHAEKSWAVTGLTDEDARAIGAAFGQIAIFRIDRTALTVLACTETWFDKRPNGGTHAQ